MEGYAQPASGLSIINLHPDVGGCGPVLIEDVTAASEINCDRGYTVGDNVGAEFLDTCPGPPGALKRPCVLRSKSGYVWRFCMSAQGA